VLYGKEEKKGGRRANPPGKCIFKNFLAPPHKVFQILNRGEMTFFPQIDHQHKEGGVDPPIRGSFLDTPPFIYFPTRSKYVHTDK